jgi:hypothetical protein
MKRLRLVKVLEQATLQNILRSFSLFSKTVAHSLHSVLILETGLNDVELALVELIYYFLFFPLPFFVPHVHLAIIDSLP